MSKTPKNKKTKCIIYTLSHPDTHEIRYIGKTVKPLKSRLADHLYSSKRENNHRTNWLKSIVKIDKIPLIEELEVCPWDNSQEREIYWIAQFKAWGFRLINLTIGGEGCIGRKMSNKTKQKIRNSNRKPIYQYNLNGIFVKEWFNATEAGIYFGKDKSKICSCARGVRKSAYNFLWSYIKVDRLPKYIKPRIVISEKQRLNLIKINSIPVLQYDLDDNFIKEWESTKVAAKELKLDYISIIEYLNGKRIKHRNKNKIGNFKWVRKAEDG